VGRRHRLHRRPHLRHLPHERGPGEASTHNVGERISWTLRPPISTKINLVKLENGDEFDVPEGGDIPAVGDEAKGSTVVEVLTWEGPPRQDGGRLLRLP
jgi:hypothetical protein